MSIATHAAGRPVLGVVGAGQLARMMQQATVGLAIDLRVLADDEQDSAAQVAPGAVVGSWRDLDDLDRFATGCDVVTFDHELVAPAHLAELERRGHVLRPSAAAEHFAQDKAYQRAELAAAGFPVPRHAPVEGAGGLLEFAEETGWPVVAKSVRGGYDGRGVWVLPDADAVRDLVEDLGTGTELLAEEFVELRTELAVAVARRPGGDQVRYAVTETVQRDGICVELVVPAGVTDDVSSTATDLAAKVVEHVQGTGVVAVELFDTVDGRLLVNELALRPHNSVHWSIDGARTSQFQNHARAVLDLPLGDTALTAPAVATVNVLGPADGSDPHDRLADALAVPGVAVHLYGKQSRPGRKLGHVTATGDDIAVVRRQARRAVARLTRQERDQEPTDE